MKWTWYHIEHAVEALRASGEAPDLSRLNLAGATLTGADLRHTNLTGANLFGANLTGANLENAGLSGVNLISTKGIAFIYVPGMSSRGDVLYAVAHEDGVYVKAGCFWGTLAGFRDEVLEQKGPNHPYLAAADFLAAALAKKD